MKTINSREVATIKRIAQSVYPLLEKKEEIFHKITLLEEQVNSLNEKINAFETGVKMITGGRSVEQLVYKTVNVVDKDGKKVKTIKYEPIKGVLDYDENTKTWCVQDLVFNDSTDITIDDSGVLPEKEEIPAEGFNPTNY